MTDASEYLQYHILFTPYEETCGIQVALQIAAKVAAKVAAAR